MGRKIKTTVIRKWFEPRSHVIIKEEITIVRASVDLRRTVWDDIEWSHFQSQVICVTSVDTIKIPAVYVIGQLIRDVIGRLSVKPRCNWLWRLNSDWRISIRL